jgi:5-methylcytosine-specific restriction enzyme subunit McrC
MNIPIRNVFYLLIYGWDRLKEAEIVSLDSLPETDYADLFARVLVSGISHALHRGLGKGYIEFEMPVAGVRGKLDISASVKRGLFLKAQAQCRFEELTYNTLNNRILRSTVRLLLRAEELNSGAREQLHAIDSRLEMITIVPLSKELFRRVQLHRNIAFYGFLLDVCELVYDNLLVDERDGATRFRDFARDEKQMAMLFERFVLNFYRREQTSYLVSREQISWKEVRGEAEQLAFLPVMKTDVVLKNATRKLIVETKYYSEALITRYKSTVRPSHLYQLFAYLQNIKVDSTETKIDGMLLYPSVGENIDLSYEISSHRIQVKTIDLAQDWPAIHRDMLGLINGVAGAGSTVPARLSE